MVHLDHRPLGETGPASVVNAMMTEGVLGGNCKEGTFPGVWALSQGGMWKAPLPHWESCFVTAIGGCPSAPLLQQRAGTQYLLREVVLSGFAKQHFGLGSWPGIQALGGTRPMGTINLLALWCVFIASSPIMCWGLALGLTSVPHWVRVVTPLASR